MLRVVHLPTDHAPRVLGGCLFVDSELDSKVPRGSFWFSDFGVKSSSEIKRESKLRTKTSFSSQAYKLWLHLNRDPPEPICYPWSAAAYIEIPDLIECPYLDDPHFTQLFHPAIPKAVAIIHCFLQGEIAISPQSTCHFRTFYTQEDDGVDIYNLAKRLRSHVRLPNGRLRTPVILDQFSDDEDDEEEDEDDEEKGTEDASPLPLFGKNRPDPLLFGDCSGNPLWTKVATRSVYNLTLVMEGHYIELVNRGGEPIFAPLVACFKLGGRVALFTQHGGLTLDTILLSCKGRLPLQQTALLGNRLCYLLRGLSRANFAWFDSSLRNIVVPT